LLDYIWFDLGYTLVYLNREERLQQVLKEQGIEKTMEEVALAYHLTDKYFMREYPGLLGKERKHYASQYQQALHHYLGIEDKEIHYHPMKIQKNREKLWRAFPETLHTLQQLKQAGVGVGLISNWNDTARSVLKETEIYPLLDHIVISSELNIEKPDKRIFEHAIEQSGVPAEKSLYVGDNYYDDVVGSRKVGMDSILINPYGKTGIEELGDQVPVIGNIKDLIPAIDTAYAPVRG
jgi:putative hydrolase of the HAD superfamily